MRRLYVSKAFGTPAQARIAEANVIVADYARQGYSLTLRQLYYQFVARGLIPNRDSEYKRLGALVSDARLAGLIDWNAIEDRTRHHRGVWASGPAEELIRAAAGSFTTEKWADQPIYAEVWIEKDALVGILDRVCREVDVPYFSCRGYVSQSAMHRAARRILPHVRPGREPSDQEVVIFHLGDHDPSGLDMSRDIEERIFLFLATDLIYEGYFEGEASPGVASARWVRDHFRLERLALNMDQVRAYDPPPNPAKVTDSRAAAYIAEHGRESWELDALEPSVLGDLIEGAVLGIRDPEAWSAHEAEDREVRDRMTVVADRWEALVENWGAVEAVLDGAGP